jgi:hypothetical protein
MTYRLSVYTGPTQVHAMALKFGLLPDTVVTLEGTEHVHVEFSCVDGLSARTAFIQSLRSVHSTAFGLGYRDVAILGEVTR